MPFLLIASAGRQTTRRAPQVTGEAPRLLQAVRAVGSAVCVLSPGCASAGRFVPRGHSPQQAPSACRRGATHPPTTPVPRRSLPSPAAAPRRAPCSRTTPRASPPSISAPPPSSAPFPEEGENQEQNPSAPRPASSALPRGGRGTASAAGPPPAPSPQPAAAGPRPPPT